MSKNVLKRVKTYIEWAKAMKPAKQTGQYYHITVICKKRKVVAVGFNNLQKQHPSHKWGEYISLKTNHPEHYTAGLHSEVSAIIKLGHEDCSQFDFFNIRINNHNELAPSKPCINCQRILNQVGYRTIYYFDNNLNLKTL